jgi:RHS repeat-associated protein
LTSLTATGSASISYTYNYPTGTNNGQISSQVVSGETITYQYDSLKRLISASSSANWADSYGYDSFGNLLSMTPTAGSPPQLSQAVNPANNQIVGQTYDANGNELSAPAGGSLTYDSENRLLTAPGMQYAYDSKNKRVWAGTLSGGNLTAQEVFVYGGGGQMLGEYSITVGSSSLTVATTQFTVYFGHKRIGVANSSGTADAFATDRLGSSGQFYPYGEGKGGNNPADTWSFATYWTDSATGLDYANQRYFSGQFGRFITPDPYRGSAHAGNPQGWNRYAYTFGDPVNGNDPTGLVGALPDTDACDEVSAACAGVGLGSSGTDLGFSSYTDGTVAEVESNISFPSVDDDPQSDPSADGDGTVSDNVVPNPITTINNNVDLLAPAYPGPVPFNDWSIWLQVGYDAACLAGADPGMMTPLTTGPQAPSDSNDSPPGTVPDPTVWGPYSGNQNGGQTVYNPAGANSSVPGTAVGGISYASNTSACFATSATWGGNVSDSSYNSGAYSPQPQIQGVRTSSITTNTTVTTTIGAGRVRERHR